MLASLQRGTIALGVVAWCIAGVAFAMGTRDVPMRFVPPRQRWGTYGTGARLFALAWGIIGLVAIVAGLVGVRFT